MEQTLSGGLEDIRASLEKMRKLPPGRVAVITTGAQGEPTSALVRMANRDHRHIEIQPGDTVVLSSSPIPGNELLINQTIDNLYRLGAAAPPPPGDGWNHRGRRDCRQAHR